MHCIETIARPKDLDELRHAVNLLLVDQLDQTASVYRQGCNLIEYEDNSDDDAPVHAVIIVVDADRHSNAWIKARMWADDAPPDTSYAGNMTENEGLPPAPESDLCRGDVLVSAALSDTEAVILRSIRDRINHGWSAGQILRRMSRLPIECDPAVAISYDPGKVGDAVPGILRDVRGRLLSWLETECDPRIEKVKLENVSHGSTRFLIDLKAPSGARPDRIAIDLFPFDSIVDPSLKLNQW